MAELAGPASRRRDAWVAHYSFQVLNSWARAIQRTPCPSGENTANGGSQSASQKICSELGKEFWLFHAPPERNLEAALAAACERRIASLARYFEDADRLRADGLGRLTALAPDDLSVEPSAPAYDPNAPAAEPSASYQQPSA